jgi:transposase-like protein
MSEGLTAKRQRVSWSDEERVDWVRVFEKSGEGVSEFCRHNDLPEATLSPWRRQLRGPEAPAEESVFVEVPPAKLCEAAAADKAVRSVAITAQLGDDISAKRPHDCGARRRLQAKSRDCRPQASLSGGISAIKDAPQKFRICRACNSVALAPTS